MIDILLATYNGEKYLVALIESLFAQTYREWRVIAHDDGSTDATSDILRNYAHLFPSRFIFIDDGVRLGGAKENFSHLITFSTAEYVMFCDQDDIWLPDKIQMSMTNMQLCEQNNDGKPIVVHTDLTVVNESLHVIAESMFNYQCLSKQLAFMSEIVVQNNVTGCTMLVNRAVIECALPIPEEAIMHDWWIAAKVLLSGGLLSFMPQSTILYRQHDKNTIGSIRISVWYYLKKLSSPRSIIRSYNNVFFQARLLGFKSYLAFLLLKTAVLLSKMFRCVNK